jgi:formate hydrogenlyase subunit 4
MWDIWKLSRKGSAYSSTISIVFKIAPSIYFSSVVIASMFIPFGNQQGVFSFSGDFVFFAYLLAIGKFFNIIGALDTGSSFEGMGASREALYSLFAEPAFFLIMGSLALLSGHTSFVDIFATIHLGSYISYAIATLAAIVLGLTALIENSRMPVDDPKTHLELTMVHEVMILDYSGFDLGLVYYSTHLKFAIYGALIANLFLASVNYVYIAILIYLAVQIIFAIVVGTVESFIARFRMNHNPQYIFTLTTISLIIFIMVLIVIEKI